jgi:hypothetical protein
MRRNLPPNFPPCDPKTGTWTQAAIEAWTSENLTGPKYAIQAMRKIRAISTC